MTMANQMIVMNIIEADVKAGQVLVEGTALAETAAPDGPVKFGFGLNICCKTKTAHLRWPCR